MRYRTYHVPIDLPPSWGQITGFGVTDTTIEWMQPPSSWQLMVIHFGGIYTVNGCPVPFPPKSALIAPPGSRCSIERTTDSNITQFWIKFKPDPAAEVTMALPQVHPMGPEFEHYDMLLRSGMDFMPISRAKLNAVSWSLLWAIAENAAVTPEEPALAVAEAFIKENLASPLEVSHIAVQVGISPSRLHAIFREHHRQTPAEYIRTLRMQLACVLLTKTDKPVKEVATISGYPDLHRFNKVVRQTFGCSPRTLRLERPSFDAHTTAAQSLYQDAAAAQSEKPRY